MAVSRYAGSAERRRQSAPPFVGGGQLAPGPPPPRRVHLIESGARHKGPTASCLPRAATLFGWLPRPSRHSGADRAAAAAAQQ